MKTKILTLSLFSFIFTISLTSCGGKFSKTDNGIIVTVNQDDPSKARKVRLQVVNDKIIRVSATPENNFASDASLVVLEPSGKTPFVISETDSTVSVTTAELTATVTIADGSVKFFNKEGKLLGAEDPASRTFTPIRIEGTDGYTVSQSWRSINDDEGLYGLGQHQADEFNYKGKSEELFQYNTKVSVPFIISTDGYGILWDSYSFTRFGRPESHKQLGEVFRLFDKDGNEGALTGTYTSIDGAVLKQREDSIYFEHLIRGDLSHVVNLPRNFNFAGSEIIYEGEIEPHASGNHQFNLYYSGYQKVFIDGKEVMPERWRTSWNPNAYKFNVNLEKGKRVPIRLEWKPVDGVAYCGLRAYGPDNVIPESQIAWWSEMQPQLDYYFIAGDSMDDVIHGYRSLTGKASILPKWSFGFWQSREKYNTSEEVLSTLTEFRRRGIPIDNIVLDWLHWREDSWGSHEFDLDRFPDPKAMIDSVHKMNGHFMISVWPKFYVTTEHFKEFDEKGWMYKLPVKDSIRDWVGPGYLGSFYDAYNPDARKLFWKQIQDHYLPLGIDAWWMDASEPNIRDCTDIQYRKDLITPTYLGPSTQYFNAYGLVNADAIYNGQRSADPDKRVFLLTRSGFAGQQRYSTTTWSGDIATRWEDLKAQISAGLNFAASGIPFWSMDIGGFCVEPRYSKAQREFNESGTENPDLKEWRELNTRWYQFGAFVPMFRAHGQWPFREIFNIAPEDHEAYRSILFYTRLRYDLMPYIYSLAGMTHFDDYTIMRPMVFDFADDMASRNIGDQFMFGPAFLVAPVYSYGARSRNVYFPAQSLWYDFYSGVPAEGGQTMSVSAPYQRIPLFVKAGSIITFGPEISFTDEQPADLIHLYVYEGADGQFTLYEDEGSNYNYEKGHYSMIPISYDNQTKTLTIGKRQGKYDGMLSSRSFNIVKIGKDDPKGFDRENKGCLIDYNGESTSVKL